MRYAIKSSDGYFLKEMGKFGYELALHAIWFNGPRENVEQMCKMLNNSGDRKFEVIEDEEVN